MIKNLLSKYQDGKDFGPSRRARGFTLLELLIVIALLAILAVVVILVLNPAETLRKARDSQRLSDLSTLKSALGIYLTEIPSPDLDGAATDFDNCEGNGTTPFPVTLVWGGSSGDDTTITGNVTVPVFGTGFTLTGGHQNFAREAIHSVGGLGWLPANLLNPTGAPAGWAAPISSLPVDPNFSAVATDPAEATDRLYVFACADDSAFSWELNTVLESTANTSKEQGDGGNNTTVYEVGTNLQVLSSW